MQHKDFDNWNKFKKELHTNGNPSYAHEREIWWCSLGINVGSEQDGTGINFDRPVLVVKGFNQNIFFGVALTGQKREGKYYFYIGKTDGRDSSAILSQVRLIDAKRLVRKMGTIDEATFLELKKALRKTLLD